MDKKYSRETLCVQAGWTPKKANRAFCLFIKVPHSSMTPANRWRVCSIWKIRDISIHACKTPPMMPSPQNRSIGRWCGCYADLVRPGCQLLCHFQYLSGRRPLRMLVYHLRRYIQSVWRHAEKLGIECTFIDANASEEEIDKAFRPNTKALFGETISNPSIDVLDIEKFARIAHNTVCL